MIKAQTLVNTLLDHACPSANLGVMGGHELNSYIIELHCDAYEVIAYKENGDWVITNVMAYAYFD